MIKVVCMGDSITEGFCIGAEDNYPYLLGELLGKDYVVVNKGVCCSTAMDIMLGGEVMGQPYARQARYKEALAEKGDIYVLMLGTNDAQDGKDDVEDITYPLCNMISRKEEFADCFQSMIDDVKEAAPHAVIYLGIPMPIQQCIWRKHQEKYLQELMPYYEELLRKNPHMKKIDVHGAFEKLPEEERLALYLEDGLHPNRKGTTLIARTVCEAILRD